MQTESYQESREANLPKFYVKNDTSLKYMTNKIINELEQCMQAKS